MKRTLFFVGIFLLFQTYSYSNVLLRKLDKTNSILKSSDVGNMYIDKSNRIWINLAQQLVCYDKQLDKWTDFSQIILENMKYEYNDGVKASNTKVWHYTEDE